MQVGRWNDSLAVRLPSSVVDALQLQEGDEVTIEVAADRELQVARQDDPDAALARLDALARPVPPGWTFFRNEANAR